MTRCGCGIVDDHDGGYEDDVGVGDGDGDGAGGGTDRGCGRGPRQPAQLLRVCPALHSAAGPLSLRRRWSQANRKPKNQKKKKNKKSLRRETSNKGPCHIVDLVLLSLELK